MKNLIAQSLIKSYHSFIHPTCLLNTFYVLNIVLDAVNAAVKQTFSALMELPSQKHSKLSCARHGWVAGLQKMRGNDPFCLERICFLLGLEGTKSLENPLTPDLIPKRVLLYVSGKQGKDPRCGGLKNLSEYEDSRLFNCKIHWSSPLSKG